jgi:hypothetical protein
LNAQLFCIASTFSLPRHRILYADQRHRKILMAGLQNFWRDERGSSFESMAFALSVVAIMFVAGADLLNYASRKDGFLARVLAGHGPEMAFMTHDTPAGAAGVDYTSTGSIIGLRHPPSLNPCISEANQ